MKTKNNLCLTPESAESKEPADRSTIYWRSFARRIFSRHPVKVVIVATSGRKMDLPMERGQQRAPEGCYYVAASTGGRYGKSRCEFPPVKA